MHIPDDDRKIMEQSILLPMLLTILERDRQIFEQLPVKLKPPYLNLIEKTMRAVQADLHQAKKQMKQNNLKAFEKGRDESFTHYLFVYNRYEEKHSFFNPRLKNLVQELMVKYLNNM